MQLYNKRDDGDIDIWNDDGDCNEDGDCNNDDDYNYNKKNKYIK